MTGKVKNVLCVLLSVLLLSSFSLTAFADSMVTWKGSTEQFVTSTGDSDLFDEFKNAMPGDTLTQTIRIRNLDKDKKSIYVYLRALGADAEGQALLAKLHLKVAQRNGSTLYDGPADQSGTLAGWRELGTLKYGDQATLDVTLTIPFELENQYQTAMGKVNWQIKAAETVTSSSSSTYKGPKTGDSGITRVWFILTLAAGMAAAVFFLVGKRRKKTEQ